MKEKKKVLIITYYWPPSGGAGVQRWLKFSKYLPGFDWEPIIYTPENPEAPIKDNSLFDDVNPNIKVLKRTIWEPYSFYKRLTGKSKSQSISVGFLQEKKPKPLLEKISVFIRGNLFIPDAKRFWVKPSVKFLKHYIKENNIKAVISTGPPHSMHLIALRLKKKLNVKWIADFRDPWTNIDFYHELRLLGISDRKHKRLEREALSNADTVVSVSKTWGDELKELGAKKVKIITNGFDDVKVPTSKPSLDKKFSIVHVGSINKDRNHRIFWEVILNIAKNNSDFKNALEIKLIGKVDYEVIEQIKMLSLLDNLNYIDYIPHEEVIKELVKSWVLYLPINNTPNAKGIIPGKFFEYLASQRPILTIGLTESDIANILKKTNSGVIFDFDDFENIQGFILQKFRDYETGEENVSITNEFSYSRKNLTKQLSELLNDLCDDQKNC